MDGNQASSSPTTGSTAIADEGNSISDAALSTNTNENAATSHEDKSYRLCPRRPYSIPAETMRQEGEEKRNRPNHLQISSSVIGLGCSSFSKFYSQDDDHDTSILTRQSITKNHPAVQTWIKTIHHAILNKGIDLLDTAPWYGHGTSEIVIGYALEDILCFDNEDDVDEQQQQLMNIDASTKTTNEKKKKINRKKIIINTKVGRYDATPLINQFDYSYKTTISSTKMSISRMKCKYIDVLQLHDVEFTPCISTLLEETIPAMIYCRDVLKIVRALGITGYSLEVQHEILVKSSSLLQKGENEGEVVAKGIVFDQSLTYCHANLHDLSLFEPLVSPQNNNNNSDDTNQSKKQTKMKEREKENKNKSFADFCHSQSIALLTAAPFSMGLLTSSGPPLWHPGSTELKRACKDAAEICRANNVDIANLALLFSLSRRRRREVEYDNGAGVVSLIVGMKDTDEIDQAVEAALRFSSFHDDDCADDKYSKRYDMDGNSNDDDAHLKYILTQNELAALETLRDKSTGPFSSVWKNGEYQWNGVQIANDFWNDVEGGKEAAKLRMKREK
mmetsp:Transcript_33162/g.48424  ORF Transcript_33162/g.48424 Transcript_33162/m.48424 type:complete len:561 (-) Transcript_33162:665-2347(-)